MTDPIADYLTRIRNAYLAGKKIVEIPSSKMKVAITKILCDKGYILSYKIVEGEPYNTIKISSTILRPRQQPSRRLCVSQSQVCAGILMWRICRVS